MELNGSNIVVVGAGIGGLAAALSLRARGADVTVLEQAQAITEVGAGLQITPNGVTVLRALNLENALAATSVRGQAVALCEHTTGAEVVRLDLTRLAANQSYYFVHRADLIDLLALAVRQAGVQVRLLQKVERVEPEQQSGAGSRVVLANGAVLHADLVVGADGLHSRARLALNNANPRMSNSFIMATRALIVISPRLPITMILPYFATKSMSVARFTFASISRIRCGPPSDRLRTSSM